MWVIIKIDKKKIGLLKQDFKRLTGKKFIPHGKGYGYNFTPACQPDELARTSYV